MRTLARPTRIVPTRRCTLCGYTGEVEAPAEGLAAWQSGVPLQFAMPELPAPVREQLKTGLHQTCFDRMAGRR